MAGNYSDDPTLVPYVDYGMGVVATLSLMLVISMVLALGGNVMVILTIARHQGMRTRTNLLLANLAVADILVAVLDMPIALVTIVKGKWIFSTAFCFFNGFTVGLGLMLSVHTLMWISIHKYISITKPFSRVTPRKIVLMIMGAWLWTIFFNLTPTPVIGLTETMYKEGASQCGPPPPKALLQYVHAALNTTINLVIPCAVMSRCYYKIFKEVKDHLSRMQEFADVTVRNSLIQQKQITETLCIVLSVFILFWLPYIIYSLSLVFLGQANVPRILNPIAYMFGYMNSACNPIIYALRSPSFRRGFGEIICWRSHYMPVNRMSSTRSHGPQHVGGVVMSFRRSLWKSQKKNEMKFPHKNQQSYGRQANAQKKIGKKPEPVEEQKTQMSNDDVKLNCKNVMPDGPRVSVSEKEPTETNSYANEVDNLKYNELSSCNSEGKELDENSKISNTNEVEPVDSVSDMNEKESTLNEVHTKASQISKSTDCIDTMDLDSDAVNIRERSASASHGGNKVEIRKSVSQQNVLSLLGNNLDAHIDGRRISNSHREIIVTTAGIMSDQIRSVSAGDVRLPPSSSLQRQDIPPPLQVPIDPRKRPLLWQASIDNLTGSPLLSSRRRFHLRRVVESPKLGERVRSASGTRKKKWSMTSSSSNKHLGVAALFSNVKKSLTDLFHLDGETDDNQGEVNVESVDVEETANENSLNDV